MKMYRESFTKHLQSDRKGCWIVISILACICLVPFLIMLAQSFLSNDDTTLHFTLRQYEDVLLNNLEFHQWFWNSVIYVSGIILINVPISILAGYAFSQFHFRGKNILFFLYIVLMLMPFQATIVPQYLTLSSFNLLNTRSAIIFPNAFGAFGAFLMTQYMNSIGNELLEAGRLDGLNDFTLLTRLIIPLCKPAISALIILLFIDHWSMIEQPVVFLQDVALYPLSVQLTGSQVGDSVWAASSLFSVLPMLIYLMGYRDLLRGISLGSIK